MRPARAARTASFLDIPSSCVVRIAAKLDVIVDILRLRTSCKHARECLGDAEWAILTGWKGLGPRQAPSRPETTVASTARRQLHWQIREYDALNSPSLSQNDFVVDYKDEEFRKMRLSSRFKGVLPGAYHVCADADDDTCSLMELQLQLSGRTYDADVWGTREAFYTRLPWDVRAKHEEPCLLERRNSRGKRCATHKLRIATSCDIRLVVEIDGLPPKKKPLLFRFKLKKLASASRNVRGGREA